MASSHRYFLPCSHWFTIKGNYNLSEDGLIVYCNFNWCTKRGFPCKELFENDMETYYEILDNSKYKISSKLDSRSAKSSKLDEDKNYQPFACLSCMKLLTKEIKHKHNQCPQVLPIEEAVHTLKSEQTSKIDGAINKIASSIYILWGYENMKFIVKGKTDSRFEKRILNELLEPQDLYFQLLSALNNLESLNQWPDFYSFCSKSKSLLEEVERKSYKHSLPLWMLKNLFKPNLAIFLGAVNEKVYVYDKTTQKVGLMTFFGEDILIDCLRPIDGLYPDSDIMIPYGLVKDLLPKDKLSIFMEMSHKKDKKKIFIDVDSTSKLSEQFVAMCSGEKKYSYLCSNFHRISWVGLPGQHIWGGDHKMGNGGGTKGLIDGDVPSAGKKYPLVKGLVAARNGFKDKSTIFRIYVESCDKGEEQFKIGQVKEGIDFLNFISNCGEIDKLCIDNCGLVLPVG